MSATRALWRQVVLVIGLLTTVWLGAAACGQNVDDLVGTWENTGRNAQVEIRRTDSALSVRMDYSNLAGSAVAVE